MWDKLVTTPRCILSCALALASSSAPPHTAPPRRRPASLLPRRQQRRRDFASPCRIPPSPPPARSRRRCSASSRRVVPGRSSYCVDQIQKLRPSAATGAASGKRCGRGRRVEVGRGGEWRGGGWGILHRPGSRRGGRCVFLF